MAIGSATAFLVGQLLDVAVFNRLRAGSWWRAPFVASVVGSVLDTAIFFTIAFSAALELHRARRSTSAWANEAVPLLGRGPVAPLWSRSRLADFMVKLGIAVFALAPFRAARSATTRQRG